MGNNVFYAIPAVIYLKICINKCVPLCAGRSNHQHMFVKNRSVAVVLMGK